MSASVEERLTRLEVRADVQDERLIAGNNRFRELELAKPGVKFWVPIALTVSMTVGGWVWALAQLPDRAEVKVIAREQSPYLADKAQILEVVKSYDTDRDITRGSLESIRLELSRISNKLDTALAQPQRRRR